ncbi:c-type cytochrome [Simplicispira suum]|uniref:Cytochrome C n=1 Tax=Simplicispira suum TaxID=2109915 RepID=A0A2S0N0R5_9BURK|nr:c-type cytochrome [Simplicispira suum]AVO41735.1 cytochrome C [Simplicispira suum]
MKPCWLSLALGLAGSLLATTASAAPDAAALARGEQVYARCAACHAIEANRTGPQHCGLFGRRAGTAPGYADYSKAMRASTTVWNEKSLNVFLRDPMKAVPGTAMGYAGVKDDAERADLIAWLKQASRPGVACTVRH